MNARYVNIFKDRILFWVFLGTLFFLVVTFLSIIITYNSFPPLIPLFNQQPWGEQRLGEKPFVFLPLVLAGVLFVINFFIGTTIYSKVVLLSRVLTLTSFLIAFLAFLFTVRTIHIIL